MLKRTPDHLQVAGVLNFFRDRADKEPSQGLFRTASRSSYRRILRGSTCGAHLELILPTNDTLCGQNGAVPGNPLVGPRIKVYHPADL